jgi:exodeoxyribonuclease VII small subunit
MGATVHHDRDQSGTKLAGAGAPTRMGVTMSTPELSYEQARAELAGVVEKLEAGGATLEESLALWERGEQLAGICQLWLDGARGRLDAARAQSEQK